MWLNSAIKPLEQVSPVHREKNQMDEGRREGGEMGVEGKERG